MKNLYRIFISCLAVFSAINVSGHKYYFKQDQWVFGNLALQSVTLKFNNGQQVVLAGSALYSYTSSERITSITRSMVLRNTETGATTNVEPYTLEWPADRLQMSIGNAPVYPLACWDPGMVIDVNPVSMYTDQQVQINIDRKGYTGPLQICAGNNSGFTNRSFILYDVPANINSITFVPEDRWNSFSNILGGDLNAYVNPFYLRYEATFYYGISNLSSFELNPVPKGPYMLKPVLNTNLPETGLHNICDIVQMSPNHVPPPYKITAKQRDTTKVIFDNYSNTTLPLDYATLYDKTGFVNNIATEIVFSTLTIPAVETRVLEVVFLGQAPDITGKEIQISEQSCEDVEDGGISIKLPEKNPVFDLRINISGTYNYNSVSPDDSAYISLPHGEYTLDLEYQNDENIPLGCHITIGNFEIPLVDRLKIVNITESGAQTCFYRNDAQLTVNTIGGVREGPLTYYNIGINTSENNVFPNLSGNTRYTFMVSDIKGCYSDTMSHTTTHSDTLKININSQTELKCNGDKGTITISGKGGHNSYEFSLDGGLYTSSQTFSNLSGTVDHIIKMRDASLLAEACTTSAIITFPEPRKLEFLNPAFSLSDYNGYNIRCANDYNGEIKLFGSGGTGEISFTLSGTGTIVQDNGIFSMLSSGFYSAHLSDENGCYSDTLKNITLTQPEGIDFNEPEIIRETCNDTRDGEINMTLTGEPTSYQWYYADNTPYAGQASKDLSGAGAGSYILEARYNADACSTRSVPYIIPARAQLDMFVTSHESCADGNGGGQLTLTGIINGTAPYYYVFTDGISHTINSYPIKISDLNEGEYTLEVHDENFNKGGVYIDKCKISKTIIIPPKNETSITTSITEPLCFGDRNGTLTSVVNGPDNPYINAWYNSTNETVGSGNILSNIPKGIYSALTKDEYNCSTIHPGIVVGEPAKIVFTNITTEKSACTESGDGIISFGSQGGIIPYKYSINGGSSWQVAPALQSLVSGSYQILTKDDHGCIVDTNVIVDAYDPALQLVSYDSASCYGKKDAGISCKANFGKTVNYTYFLKGDNLNVSNATGSFNNLGQDDYILFARDIKGCYTDTLIQNIWEPDALDVDLILTDSAACGQPTGIIAFQIAGGNGNNKLLWSNDQIGETTELNTSELRTGIYLLTVSDRKACSQSASILVPDRPAPVITDIEILEQTWCDLPLGSVKVKVSGGSPRYTYLWDNVAGDTTATISSLTEGSYKVTVADRYHCKDQGSIVLIDGPEIELESDIENPHCGQKDGNVVLQVTGGVEPFTYQWPDSISEDPLLTGIMNNLYSGTYLVKIADNVGCNKIFTVNLADLSGPKILSVDTSKAWCGLPRGTASVFATGGFSPYSYVWTPSGMGNIVGTNASIGNLKAGNYTVVITDAENCKAIQNIHISDSLELQPSLILTDLDSAACNKPLGSLTVTLSNGLAPSTYNWNTGATGNTLTNLLQGSYMVRATDQRGCHDSLKIQLSERKNPLIVLQSKESSYCGKPTGSVTFTGSLGRSPYRAYLMSDLGKNNTLTYNETTKRFEGTIDSLFHSSTAYRIKLDDADGCGSNEIGVLIADNDPMSLHLADVSPVSCYGYSDGQAVISAENGYEPYSYVWNINTINSSINSSLPAGPFNVTATDSKGCSKILYVTGTPVLQPEPVAIGLEFISNPSCYGVCDGSVSPVAIGGNGNYIYIWNNSDTLQTKSDLCAGDHSLKMMDAKNCTITKTYTIVNPSPLTDTELPESTTICSGQHFLANPGIEWNNVTWSSDNDFVSVEHIADISRQGEYYMSGLSQKGCLVKDTIKVLISDDLLDAQFLMMSEAYAGDTVIIIEVSWPVADKYTWDFPETAKIINEGPLYKELVFDEAGNFYVQLTATLAGCSSVRGKYIEILDVADNPDTEQSAEVPPLIRSFDIYPNPAVSNFNVNVELTEEKDIRIEIFAVGGGNLNRQVMGYSLNEYSIPVNTEELTRGTYVVRLIAGNEVKTKILIVR